MRLNVLMGLSCVNGALTSSALNEKGQTEQSGEAEVLLII